MRDLPGSGFAGDHGVPSPGVPEALAAYDAPSDDQLDTRYVEALAVLQHARLLVPVVAVLGEVEHAEHGLPHDKTSHDKTSHDKTSDMATVLMRGRDGRTALLAFTSTASLHRWNPEARPVPVTVQRAAQAAVQDDAAAVLVDVAGPVMFVVETDDLRELALGSELIEVSARDGGGLGWARPAR